MLVVSRTGCKTNLGQHITTCVEKWFGPFVPAVNYRMWRAVSMDSFVLRPQQSIAECKVDGVWVIFPGAIWNLDGAITPHRALPIATSHGASARIFPLSGLRLSASCCHGS
jgi:hypothetical protein